MIKEISLSRVQSVPDDATPPSIAGSGVGQRIVQLLDVDCELAAAIPAGDFERARARSAVRVVHLDAGRWNLTATGPHQDLSLGVLVLDGLLLRSVSVGAGASCELLGPGDLCRPCEPENDYEPLKITVEWRALEPTRLALLDRNFALRTANWPTIQAALAQRATDRARHLALAHAITHQPRISARLILLFWLLAERWGKVTPLGITISLPLTHQMLARLVGAQRPSVSVALGALSRRGLLVRQNRNRWLLTHQVRRYLHHPDQLSVLNQEHDAAATPA